MTPSCRLPSKWHLLASLLLLLALDLIRTSIQSSITTVDDGSVAVNDEPTSPAWTALAAPRPPINETAATMEDTATTTTFIYSQYHQVHIWTIPPNDTEFLYRQFCKWTSGKKARKHLKGWFQQRIMVHNSSTTFTKLLHMQLDCDRTQKESPFGTGNWVQGIYAMRLAALGSSWDLLLTCIDDDKRSTLVLPWLMGHFRWEATRQFLSHFWNTKVDTKCYASEWGKVPVGWMLPLIQDDLRRMAVALVYNEATTHHVAAQQWLQDYTTNSSRLGNDKQDSFRFMPGNKRPLIPNITLDDVVIHFRCGDTMISKHVLFRFIKFREFANRIDPHATASIGIVTQSFGGRTRREILAQNSQARPWDVANEFRISTCQALIDSFQDYLHERFPKARVSIHNGPSETVALAYARLVFARQAFSYPDSSFSVFPTLASFGQGYHLYPIKSPYSTASSKNQWLRDIYRHSTAQHQAKQIQFLNVSRDESLFAVETLWIREHYINDTMAQHAIVTWFSDDDARKPEVPKNEIKGP